MLDVRRLLAVGALALSIVACSSGAVCGDGTRQEGDVCLGDDDATSATATTTTTTTGAGGATASSTSTTASGGTSLLDALPPCAPAPAPHDGSIDLATACVEGVCMGMTFAEVNSALGAQGDCMSSPAVEGSLFCSWSGLEIIFDDIDGDGVPDPGSTTTGISLIAPFRGTTSDGLGIGATLRCFVDSLGAPTEIEAIDHHGSIEINELQFGAFKLLVDDGTPFPDDPPDGYVDALSIFGPLH
jgi:hypothetical protein